MVGAPVVDRCAATASPLLGSGVGTGDNGHRFCRGRRRDTGAIHRSRPLPDICLPDVRGNWLLCIHDRCRGVGNCHQRGTEIESEEKAILVGMDELKVRLDRIEATLLLPVVDRTSPQLKGPASGTPKGSSEVSID